MKSTTTATPEPEGQNRQGSFIDELKKDPTFIACGFLRQGPKSKFVPSRDLMVMEGKSFDNKALFITVTNRMVIIKEATQQPPANGKIQA